MNVLFDTHLLLWAATEPETLSDAADALIRKDGNVLHFSVVSIWEVAIKFVKHRSSFKVSPDDLRTVLLASGYRELELKGAHVLATTQLPLIHRDPFDRVLLAQALVEGIPLATIDGTLTAYAAPVLHVR